jgi:tetratricopeptide (TPR) repeat protein
MEALNGLVVLSLAKKDFSRARQLVDARLAEAPNDAPALVLAAMTYSAQGDVARAEGLLRKAIEANASHLPAYLALGRLYLAQRRLDEACAEFDRLASRAPRPAPALTMAGLIRQMQKRDAEARDRFERALRADPNAAVAATNLAWMLAESGTDLDRALQLAQSAKAQLPDLPQVGDTLGWVYYKKGLAALSVPLFRQSVEQDPRNGTYQLHLALAYAQTGDREGARRALDKALQIQPDLRNTEDGRRLAETLLAGR